MRWPLVALASMVAITAPLLARAEPQVVRAAPIRGDDPWSPRRLFNAGLAEEERGNLTRAVQFLMAARLSDRHSVADELYAKGAGLRLLRLLASHDDDAAAAAAVLVRADGAQASDLAPLVRTLLRRLDQPGRPELEVVKGHISSVRYDRRAQSTSVEVETDGDERRLFLADGPVGPFSAGDPVRLLVRRERTRASAGWRVVAMGHAKADGWQLLAVSGLPGEPGPEYGALLFRP